MRGILALLFLYVTLHLADGNFYNRRYKRGRYREFEPDSNREDLNSVSGSITSRLEEDINGRSKVSFRAFQKPLCEKGVIIFKKSSEDRSPSVSHGVRWRDSSVSSGLGMTFRQSLNVSPGFQHGISFKSDSEEKKNCFIRQFLDVINLYVGNVYRAATSENRPPPEGPQFLHLLVKELTENLESIDKIEVLDKAALKTVKVIRIFFRMLRQNFKYQSFENPEMSLARVFFSQIELLLQDFIDLSEEKKNTRAPVISLLLDSLNKILVDLTEIKQHVGSHVNEVRGFIQDAQTVADALVKGVFNLKGKSEIRGPDLRQILFNAYNTLKDLIDENVLFDENSGIAEDFLHKVLTRVEKELSEFLEDFSL